MKPDPLKSDSLCFAGVFSVYSALLDIKMFAGRANFLRASRNLTQRTQRKATEDTESPGENKDEYRTEIEKLISLWSSAILRVLCVALFGI
jgi:hypothetical protein